MVNSKRKYKNDVSRSHTTIIFFRFSRSTTNPKKGVTTIAGIVDNVKKSPDHHILEIGETQSAVIARLLDSGMTAEETAAKTRLPISAILETGNHGNSR